MIRRWSRNDDFPRVIGDHLSHNGGIRHARVAQLFHQGLGLEGGQAEKQATCGLRIETKIINPVRT